MAPPSCPVVSALGNLARASRDWLSRCPRSHVILACASLASAAALVVHASRYAPYMVDDAFISFVYARRLAGGLGLTWSDGQRVEGYSNLLWVMLLAAVAKTGLSLVSAARFLGASFVIAAQVASIYCTTVVAESRWRMRASWPVALYVGLTIGIVAPMAVWAIGGLEAPLLAMLVTWGFVLTAMRWPNPEERARPLWFPGVLFGLACWTRPDAPLFTLAASAGVVIIGRGRRPAWKAAFWVAAVAGAFVLAQLFFRWGYYGEWVPNTARAKIAWTAARRSQGLDYATRAFITMAPIGALAAIGWFQLRKTPASGWATAVMIGCFTWIAYWVVAGGDIFPAYRPWVPVIPLLAMLGGLGLGTVPGPTWLRSVLVVAAVGYVGVRQRKDPENRRPLSERNTWELAQMGITLRAAFAAARPLLGSESAGALAYYSEMPFLDMLGLNDNWISKHPPTNVGQGFIGHELGDAEYILERRPDLFFINVRSLEFRVTRELWADPRFKRDYQPVVVENPTCSPAELGSIWIRIAGRLGVQHSAGRVIVPAYLLSRAERTYPVGGFILTDGVPTRRIDGFAEYVLPDVVLEAGIWHLVTEPESQLGITPRSRVPAPEIAEEATSFRVQTGRRLIFVASPVPLSLRRVILIRAG
jgi:arabinofuranosyltransferase